MKGALWKLPMIGESTNEILKLEKLADIDTTLYGNELKVIAYHPSDGTKAISVVDNNFVLWDLNNDKPQVLFYNFLKNIVIISLLNNVFNFQVITNGTLSGKGQPRFTNGKWNLHNGCNQFVTINENNVRGWDLRNPSEYSWNISNAHSQIIR